MPVAGLQSLPPEKALVSRLPRGDFVCVSILCFVCIARKQEQRQYTVNCFGRDVKNNKGRRSGEKGEDLANLAGLFRQASVSSLPAATMTGTPAAARLCTARSSAYCASPPSAITATAGER